MLAWTDAFLADASASPALQREMLAHFTPAEIVELAAANAIFMGFSKIALALGDVPDDLPLMEQATPDVPGEERAPSGAAQSSATSGKKRAISSVQ